MAETEAAAQTPTVVPPNQLDLIHALAVSTVGAINTHGGDQVVAERVRVNLENIAKPDGERVEDQT